MQNRISVRAEIITNKTFYVFNHIFSSLKKAREYSKKLKESVDSTDKVNICLFINTKIK